MQSRPQKSLRERLAQDQTDVRAEWSAAKTVCAEELAEIENMVLRTLYRERTDERALAVS
jgi:hypothetical protein